MIGYFLVSQFYICPLRDSNHDSLGLARWSQSVPIYECHIQPNEVYLNKGVAPTQPQCIISLQSLHPTYPLLPVRAFSKMFKRFENGVPVIFPAQLYTAIATSPRPVSPLKYASPHHQQGNYDVEDVACSSLRPCGPLPCHRLTHRLSSSRRRQRAPNC